MALKAENTGYVISDTPQNFSGANNKQRSTTNCECCLGPPECDRIGNFVGTADDLIASVLIYIQGHYKNQQHTINPIPCAGFKLGEGNQGMFPPKHIMN